MKIGIDARLWNETGVGRYVRNLVKHLQILDHENDYVLFVRSDDEERIKNYELRIKGSKSWKVATADIRWHSWREQWEMPKILGREKLDLVHFPYFNVPILYRGPFVVTIHDLIINHFPTGRATTLPLPFYQIKRLGYKVVLNNAIKNSQKIIAVSKATRSEIIDHFGVNPDKIVVTYESGELEIKKNHESRIMNHGIKKPYILYVGNANPHKNLERLLEALELTENINLVLVGKKDFFYQKLEEKTIQMGLSKRVSFYGEADDDDLCQLYQKADALILPSLMEGFGLPALEAMMQGCLILSSDIPAFREICGDAALYFNPTDVGEIARKMERVYFDYSKEWDKLIAKGLKKSKMFSWEKMVEETLKVYRQSVPPKV